MIDSAFEDEPRTLRREKVREERRGFLRETHVTDLTDFVEKLRKEKEGMDIPDFDPLDGGVGARCLFLFEAAGGKTIPGGKTKGSGFASRNNDDASAQKFFELNAGVLDRRETISWNIVPWALREDNRNRKPNREDIKEGLRWLGKLLDLLNRPPRLEVVVLCGDYARKATGFLYEKHPDLHVLHAPHPAAQSMIQEGKKEHLEAAIKKAERLLDTG